MGLAVVKKLANAVMVRGRKSLRSQVLVLDLDWTRDQGFAVVSMLLDVWRAAVGAGHPSGTRRANWLQHQPHITVGTFFLAHAIFFDLAVTHPVQKCRFFREAAQKSCLGKGLVSPSRWVFWSLSRHES